MQLQDRPNRCLVYLKKSLEINKHIDSPRKFHKEASGKVKKIGFGVMDKARMYVFGFIVLFCFVLQTAEANDLLKLSD